MTEDDGETWYAYYCLNKFHWTPSQFVNLPIREKALVIAMINERTRTEKKQTAKANSKGGRKR